MGSTNGAAPLVVRHRRPLVSASHGDPSRTDLARQGLTEHGADHHGTGHGTNRDGRHGSSVAGGFSSDATRSKALLLHPTCRHPWGEGRPRSWFLDAAPATPGERGACASTPAFCTRHVAVVAPRRAPLVALVGGGCVLPAAGPRRRRAVHGGTRRPAQISECGADRRCQRATGGLSATCVGGLPCLPAVAVHALRAAVRGATERRTDPRHHVVGHRSVQPRSAGVPSSGASTRTGCPSAKATMSSRASAKNRR